MSLYNFYNSFWIIVFKTFPYGLSDKIFIKKFICWTIRNQFPIFF